MWKKLLLFSVVIATAGCSLERKDNESFLQFDLSDIKKNAGLTNNNFLYSVTNSSIQAPGLVSAFDCYSIVVNGPGIPSRNGEGPGREPYCSYPGVMSDLISGSAPLITLNVPTGPDRKIQVVGVTSNVGCPAGMDLYEAHEQYGDESFPHVLELGHLVTDITADTEVTVPNSYTPATPKDIRCIDDPCAHAPVKLVVTGDTTIGGDGCHSVFFEAKLTDVATGSEIVAPKAIDVQIDPIIHSGNGQVELYLDAACTEPQRIGNFPLVISAGYSSHIFFAKFTGTNDGDEIEFRGIPKNFCARKDSLLTSIGSGSTTEACPQSNPTGTANAPTHWYRAANLVSTYSSGYTFAASDPWAACAGTSATFNYTTSTFHNGTAQLSGAPFVMTTSNASDTISGGSLGSAETEVHFFMVAKPTTATDGEVIRLKGNSAADYLTLNISGSKYFIGSYSSDSSEGDSSFDTYLDPNTSNYELIHLQWTASGLFRLDVYDIDTGTITAGTGTTSAISTSINLSESVEMGSISMNIAEIQIYSGSLSTAEINSIVAKAVAEYDETQ